ncbi:hypothetical protein L6164_001785 [Bauhinia variegata]|uniref:Uncharacterized protein n=1 Tax=Bauhinia variegata TaxID=167791 RepID=A0ACB9QAK9_BAUVA|nr:hypothetical protein L6164_001785 [Bauhinia variegata]
MQDRGASVCLDCFIISPPVLGYGFPSGEVGSNWYLSGGFGGTARPFMPHRCLITRPTCARTTPYQLYKSPFSGQNPNPSHTNAAATMGASKRRLSSRGLGGALREQRAKLYIIRRCVVMLLCWHD